MPAMPSDGEGVKSAGNNKKKYQLWVELWEYERWELAAKSEGMNVAAWLRRAGRRAMEAEEKMGKVREVLQ